MTGPEPGDDVEITLSGEVAEVIEHPAGGSTRYRIDTDATWAPLVVYPRHVHISKGDAS